MGTLPPIPTVEQVAEWICSYLRDHPKAADTAEGIQRWWLAPNFGEVTLITVKQALEKLESEGEMQISDPLTSNPNHGRGPRFRSCH
jgi:hypothetical protein